jgi:hypothetical protein
MVDAEQISAVMRELGRRGGKVGGKRRLETMTAEQRSEIARNAGLKSAESRKKKKAAARSAEVRSKNAAAKKKSGKR